MGMRRFRRKAVKKKKLLREIFGLIMSGQCASERRKFRRGAHNGTTAHNFELINAAWNNTRNYGEIQDIMELDVKKNCDSIAF